MVKIRLRRIGMKKQPSYRVVVADSRSPRDGRFIETIGHYNPRTDPPTVKIDEVRALHWLLQGAQPTDAVARLLEKTGIMEKFKRVKAGASIEEVLAVKEMEKERPMEVEEKALPAVYEMPIEELELSTRVYNALKEAGLTKVGEIVERLEKGEEEILAIPDLGPKSLEELREKLELISTESR